LESAVRLTLRNLAPSDSLMGLIREHVSCLEPYEDHFVRCHLELACVEDGYQAHLQLILRRGDVVRVHASEDDPGLPSPAEALTTTFARAIAQLDRARITMPPEARSGSAWMRV
jgi:hypothetical protein